MAFNIFCVFLILLQSSHIIIESTPIKNDTINQSEHSGGVGDAKPVINPDESTEKPSIDKTLNTIPKETNQTSNALTNSTSEAITEKISNILKTNLSNTEIIPSSKQTTEGTTNNTKNKNFSNTTESTTKPPSSNSTNIISINPIPKETNQSSNHLNNAVTNSTSEATAEGIANDLNKTVSTTETTVSANETTEATTKASNTNSTVTTNFPRAIEDLLNFKIANSSYQATGNVLASIVISIAIFYMSN